MPPTDAVVDVDMKNNLLTEIYKTKMFSQSG